MKNLEFRQKFLAARCVFNSFFGVSSGDGTLRLMLDTQRALNGKRDNRDNLSDPRSVYTHTCELLLLYKFLDLVLYCDLDDELKTAHNQRNRGYCHA